MGIVLRSMREEDLEMIMNWRMSPEITKYMNTNPKLTLEIQREWFSQIKRDNSKMHWVIEKDRNPCGVIYLENINWDEKNASWGYYIGEKKARSFQLALSLEMSLYDYVFDVLELEELHNQVFSLNSEVVKLHLACGSHITEEIKEEVEKEGIKYDVTHVSIEKEEWKKVQLSKKYVSINFGLYLERHHIGYAVSNIQESQEKFGIQGYEPSSEVIRDNNREIDILFMKNKADGTLIELVAPLSNKSPVSKMLQTMKGVACPYHICYQAEDIKAAVNELKRAGYYLTAMPAPAIAFGNRNVAFMLSRETGIVEILERNKNNE